MNKKPSEKDFLGGYSAYYLRLQSAEDHIYFLKELINFNNKYPEKINTLAYHLYEYNDSYAPFERDKFSDQEEEQINSLRSDLFSRVDEDAYEKILGGQLKDFEKEKESNIKTLNEILRNPQTQQDTEYIEKLAKENTPEELLKVMEKDENGLHQIAYLDHIINKVKDEGYEPAKEVKYYSQFLSHTYGIYEKFDRNQADLIRDRIEELTAPYVYNVLTKYGFKDMKEGTNELKNNLKEAVEQMSSDDEKKEWKDYRVEIKNPIPKESEERDALNEVIYNKWLYWGERTCDNAYEKFIWIDRMEDPSRKDECFKRTYYLNQPDKLDRLHPFIKEWAIKMKDAYIEKYGERDWQEKSEEMEIKKDHDR